MVDVVGAAAVWSAAAWPALPRACRGPYGGCSTHERDREWLGSGREVILWSGPRRPAVLAACDPSIVEWAVLATTAMVQDAWRLYPCVRDEMRTHICGSGCGVAVVAIAVPILVSIASRSAQMLRETETCTCVPYDCNSS